MLEIRYYQTKRRLREKILSDRECEVFKIVSKEIITKIRRLEKVSTSNNKENKLDNNVYVIAHNILF